MAVDHNNKIFNSHKFSQQIQHRIRLVEIGLYTPAPLC